MVFHINIKRDYYKETNEFEDIENFYHRVDDYIEHIKNNILSLQFLQKDNKIVQCHIIFKTYKEI